MIQLNQPSASAPSVPGRSGSQMSASLESGVTRGSTQMCAVACGATSEMVRLVVS